jgi:hypothetical protein
MLLTLKFIWFLLCLIVFIVCTFTVLLNELTPYALSWSGWLVYFVAALNVGYFVVNDCKK